MPALSIVLLTWNEERNVAACLASLAAQQDKDFEVILIDAASVDRTVAIAREAAASFPVPLRIEVARWKIPIGSARNRGVQMASAPAVAFLSADAEADPEWTRRAKEALAAADMVFGQQLHAPHDWTLGAAVRGLRYHFPDGPAREPLALASNVAAVYRKSILEQFPFDSWANAAEDLLIAKRAAAAGYRAAYEPRMRVLHHDVASARAEWRKMVREGEGWGLYTTELGLFRPVLAWGGLLAGCLTAAVLAPIIGVPLLLAALWAPALRRAWRRRKAMPAGPMLAAVAASPAFDLAFLVSYLGSLPGGRRQPRENPRPQELTQ